MNNIIRLESPVTGTLGVGNIVKRYHFNKSLLNHPNLQSDGVITCLSDYEQKSKNGRSKESLNRFKTLQKHLLYEFSNNIDPIEYIIQLYYGEGLSVDSIFERLNSKGLKYSENGKHPSAVLINLFKKVFKWEFRKRSTRSELGEKRRLATLEDRIKILNKNNIDAIEKSKENTSLIVSFLTSKLNKNILFDDQEKKDFFKKSEREKTIYLLDKYYSINFNQFINLFKIHKISSERLSIIITELFINIPEEYTKDLNITESHIRYCLNFKG